PPLSAPHPSASSPRALADTPDPAAHTLLLPSPPPPSPPPSPPTAPARSPPATPVPLPVPSGNAPAGSPAHSTLHNSPSLHRSSKPPLLLSSRPLPQTALLACLLLS